MLQLAACYPAQRCHPPRMVRPQAVEARLKDRVSRVLLAPSFISRGSTALGRGTRCSHPAAQSSPVGSRRPAPTAGHPKAHSP